MANLTEQQAQFVHHFVAMGCNPTEAARQAGYSAPNQEAYRLMRRPHVLAAIRGAQERLFRTDGVRIAYSTLLDVMQDKAVSASARVSAARTICEVAGLFDKNGRDVESGKTMAEMSADELATTIAKLDAEMTRLAGSNAVN